MGKIIGIDLGTTNSCVAVMEGNEPVVIPQHPHHPRPAEIAPLDPAVAGGEPATTAGVVARMALEVLCFRSLFRNTRVPLQDGRLTYDSAKWLWAAGLAFHWSFLIILLRHLRFFAEPVPGFVLALARLDGFFQVGLPVILATTAIFLGAVTFLFLRRLVSPPLRYLSLPGDWFPLLLLLAIGLSGAWMRHVSKIDVPTVKPWAMGLLHLSPPPAGVADSAFHVHLFLVSTLLAYFPFSKLYFLFSYEKVILILSTS